MSKFNLQKFKYFCSADVETTGLNLQSSKPWQIAWINFDHKGNVLEQQDRYIWWDDLDISEDAKRVTHFDYNKYKKLAESPLDVWKDFSKTYLDEYCGLVLHNGLGFDKFIIRVWTNLLGIKLPYQDSTPRYIDTHLISKGIKLNMVPDKDNFLEWQYKVGSIRAKVKTNLKAMCLENNIEFDESRAHEASYDATQTKNLFLKYIRFKIN